MIINGNIVENDKIEVDNGFLLGKALFETILVKDKPIFLKEHLDRINKGLLKIGLKVQISEDYFMENLNKAAWENCAVKLVVSEKNIVFVKRDLNYKDEDYSKGFKATISDMYRNPKSHFTYLKSINYMDNIIERNEALKKGYNEVIFLNYEGYLSEGSISNLFWIKDEKIYTPSLECGLLPGVVRKWIISNYHVIEGKFKLDDLLNSDGAFFTNSLMGIMRVDCVEQKSLMKSDIMKSIRENYEKFICRRLYK